MTPTAPVDPGEVLTLAEAAERLGVHYMTAYRYVRTGRLDAHKDGVEWRVRSADVDALADGGSGAVGGTPRPPADWSARVEERLLAGDEAGAWNVIENAMGAGMSPEGIYIDVLGPALRSIGIRWEDGRATVGDEHLASAVVLRLIGRLGPRFARRGRKRGTIVVAAPAGDTHGLPVALFADLLRGRGFRVVDLGADVPHDSLASTVAGADRLRAVGLCATTSSNDDSLEAAIAAIRAVTPAPVVLGGRAIDGPTGARAHGADDGGRSTRDELDRFDELTRARR